MPIFVLADEVCRTIAIICAPEKAPLPVAIDTEEIVGAFLIAIAFGAAPSIGRAFAAGTARILLPSTIGIRVTGRTKWDAIKVGNRALPISTATEGEESREHPKPEDRFHVFFLLSPLSDIQQGVQLPYYGSSQKERAGSCR